MTKELQLPVTVRALKRDASEEDVEALTTVLVDAFREGNSLTMSSPASIEKGLIFSDKMTSFLVGGFMELLPDLQRCQVKSALIDGKAYVSELEGVGIIGGAVWFGPGQDCTGTEEQRSAGLNQLMESLKEKDPDIPKWFSETFFVQYSALALGALEGPDYKLASWHCQLLGVLPSYQRKGVGTALVTFVEADAHKINGLINFCLETQTEGTRVFYENMGYVTRGQAIMDSPKHMKETSPMWILSKEPKP
ncbi:hypothetical protein SCHPADRAFT_946725 [Schizopora paradoxa]|uniref:N-acetyltransferase domain-containing protein n=1 Tax=Schizopora paradoxa TaxID=27342 RepID=A0A0H2R1L4_9AGAM|nr:hypothetical protein SCHPADRAFT_946725 [Schizopora paradoxa]